MNRKIEKIVVIGAGTMGHGIAQVAAMAGYDVAVVDAAPGAVDVALGRIEKNLAGTVKRGKATEEERTAALERISPATDIAAAAGGADLCIEAVVENLDVKRRVFAALEQSAPAHAVFATNTSAISIGKIAATVANPGRVIGMHFFNPVHIMKLVEVVVHDRTDETTRAAALAVVKRIGKESIVVRDSPGFATSRLGVVLGLEAIRMVEENVASPGDIDKAMVLGYRHPVGPLRLTDLVGLDVRLAIAESLHAELGGDRYRPPRLLREKVAAGELGKKSGRGFYRWDD